MGRGRTPMQALGGSVGSFCRIEKTGCIWVHQGAFGCIFACAPRPFRAAARDLGTSRDVRVHSGAFGCIRGHSGARAIAGRRLPCVWLVMIPSSRRPRSGLPPRLRPRVDGISGAAVANGRQNAAGRFPLTNRHDRRQVNCGSANRQSSTLVTARVERCTVAPRRAQENGGDRATASAWRWKNSATAA
jgi:hypothetical protein